MLERIFKAYDIRGIYPDEINEDIVRAIGMAAANYFGSPHFLVGRDCRISSPALSKAFCEALSSQNVKVIDIGLCSTDMLYFASGYFNSPGAMFTASHNPPNFNGIKFCRENAAPVGEQSGLSEIRFLCVDYLNKEVIPDPVFIERRNILNEFANHVRSFVEIEKLKDLTVCADLANGMGGLICRPVFEKTPIKLITLYEELDGTFPNHPADPIQNENLVDLISLVQARGADIGLAFDGDADRVFLVDDNSVPISGSTTTAMIAKAMLKVYPGSNIVYNCICSRAVGEVIRENGGHGIKSRVGHSFIKGLMRQHDAVFGGEHSGHYYFKANYSADSGIIGALIVLALVSEEDKPLSELRKEFERYVASGEINFRVPNPAEIIERLRIEYANSGAEIEEIDGMSINFENWWFNVRPSNTEPLLRLNVEDITVDDLNLHVQELTEKINDLVRDIEGR